MKEDIKLGVSLYSYQEAIWRGYMDLVGALFPIPSTKFCWSSVSIS